MEKYKYPFGRKFRYPYYALDGSRNDHQRKYQIIFAWGDILNGVPKNYLRGFEQDWNPKTYRVYDTNGKLVSPLNSDGTPYNNIDEEEAVRLYWHREREAVG